ncbi:MAG: reprolysin-like metallopeptidase, partial [Pseudomonadota bacterium]
IMAPGLAARYPQIQTYRVRGLDDPTATGRLDLTPKGFHGMLTSSAGTVYIDPNESNGYRSYYQRDYALASKGVSDSERRPICHLETAIEEDAAYRPAETVAQRISNSRRVYRLALAATGEYTQFHGGTVAAALAAMVTAINRVNQVYGRDVAIQFVLVSNTDSVIYTDSGTDPYTNNDAFEMLLENQANLDVVIGSANYDIGHVFSTGGGGLAIVGGTCISDRKAKGVTGMPQPTGDAFYIDLVAHEMGHQVNAVHSFNGTTDSCAGVNRVADSAVEPGSGSSIMSYAGICELENLQLHSDATFHAKSIEEILSYTVSGAGGSCGSVTSTNNTAPDVNAGIAYSIPMGTPFALMGSATDVDGDTLSYLWDEMDANGTATTSTTFGTDLGDNPLFRSFLPKDTPLRVFPRLSNLLEGISDKAEVLPITPRTLNFRLTVRDGESGVGEDDVVLSVDNTKGPFKILEPVASNLTSGMGLPISWDSADTDLPPINCTTVDLHLLAFSSDGSSYCEYELASGVSNIAEFNQPILPNQGTSKGRIRLKCSSNIFFDINDNDIIVNATNTAATDCISTDGTVVAHGVVFNDADEGTTVTRTDSGGGGGALFLLPALLGFRLAGRRLKRARRPSA